MKWSEISERGIDFNGSFIKTFSSVAPNLVSFPHFWPSAFSTSPGSHQVGTPNLLSSFRSIFLCPKDQGLAQSEQTAEAVYSQGDPEPPSCLIMALRGPGAGEKGPGNLHLRVVCPAPTTATRSVSLVTIKASPLRIGAFN